MNPPSEKDKSLAAIPMIGWRTRNVRQNELGDGEIEFQQFLRKLKNVNAIFPFQPTWESRRFRYVYRIPKQVNQTEQR